MENLEIKFYYENLNYRQSRLRWIGIINLFKKKNFNVVGFDSGIFENCILSEEIAAPSVDQQIYCDLRNITTKHIQNIDVIIHLAAISNDPMGNEFEEATNEINYKSTKKLIDLAVKSKVKKFVFASSCSMYGNAKKDKKKNQR